MPGIVEVLRARFVGHVYPPHTHETWTLLIVEQGAISYDLDRAEHGALGRRVTLLPPHVPHTGRAAARDGFHKRVLYLDATVLSESLIGAAVARPSVTDPLLHERVRQLHVALAAPGDALEAESRLALIRDRLHQRLNASDQPPAATAPRLATQLRDLLDSRIPGVTLREAGAELGAEPATLVRSFTAAFGLPPHRYLIGRRIDTARRLLLAGQPVADVAAAAGFHDQPHLTRHFKRQIGTTPARYAASPKPGETRL